MYVIHCDGPCSLILLLNIVSIKPPNLDFPFKTLSESGSDSRKILSISVVSSTSLLWGGPAFNNRADDPVPRWHPRDPLAAAVPTVQRNARQRKSVLNGGFRTWADLTHKSGSRGRAAPRWGPTFWWRGRLAEGLDKTNGDKLYLVKNKSIFQPEVVWGGAISSDRSSETCANTWMHKRWGD